MNKYSFSKHIIIANGQFPTHAIPMEIIRTAETIICCDGAADSLLKHGIEPTIVIGDLDSISTKAKKQFAGKLIHITEQETNDQTKAVEWAIAQGLQDAVIVGATGKREDHTLGNISLLAHYGKRISICSVTNYGVFTPIYGTTQLLSYPGQAISIFSLTPHIPITLHNLQYPLNQAQLESWWMGTLNTALYDTFTVESDNGICIIFQAF
jgi:thiamine pyrophosphokinase